MTAQNTGSPEERAEGLITECCLKPIDDDQRYCPRCGWEARVLESDNYVAWMRYRKNHNGTVTPQICDSNTEGAFKVYRRTK